MALLSLLVKLGLDTASFQSGVKRAESSITGMARGALSSVKGQLAAAFSVGAVTAFAHSVVEAADRIGSLSDQMGISTDEVQRLDIAASRSGLNVEQLGAAFVKLGEYRKAAGEGGKDSVEAIKLSRMGITMSDIQDKQRTNEDLAKQIFGWYIKTNETAKDQADIADVIGLKAVKLVAAFKALAELGPVKLFSKEDIKALSDYNNGMQELVRNLKVAAAPGVGWWAGVMAKRNESNSAPGNKWYHMDMLVAIASGFTEKEGELSPAMSHAEVAAESAKRKAQRADMAANLYGKKQEKVDAKYDVLNKPQGGMASIGGFFFDEGTRDDHVRSIVKNTDRAAKATEDLRNDVRKNLGQ